MQLIEVIRGVANITAPFEAQPLDVLLDGVDILLLFLGRVGVIEAQMTLTTRLLRQAEIQADRLGMPYVQVAVGLRRKARHDLRVLAALQVGLNDLTQKVGWRRGFRFIHKYFRTRLGQCRWHYGSDQRTEQRPALG